MGEFGWYGQSTPPEDKIAAVLFGDYVGTYCEVGAYNGVDLSNTMYFYKRGWKGINFEPHPENYAALCINQPDAINICAATGFITGYNNIKTTPGKPIVTGFELPKWYIRDEVPGGEAGLVDLHVPTISLDYAFEIHGIRAVDLISLDVDGTELDVLHGMDFDRWQPRLIILEYNHALREINEHLAHYGYQMAHENGLNAFYVRSDDDAKIIQRAANAR